MKLGTRAAAPRMLVGLLGVILLGACGSREGSETAEVETPAAAQAERPADTGAATPATAAARDEAKEIFAMRCATCHGPEGAGDGPGSAALDPRPRNFQDPAWQSSVDDEHIANIIQYGGAAVGKSPAMPGNPDLSGRPQVVEALISLIRDLGRG